MSSALLGYVISTTAQSSFLVIVNSENDIESMTSKEVSDIFLKKTVKWKDKSKIKAADRQRSAVIRENFSQKVHKKSTDAIIGYWQKKIFSGRGVPPVEEELLKVR